MIMGLSGYTLTLIRLDELGLLTRVTNFSLLGLQVSLVEIFAALSIALFIVLSALYAAKAIRHRESVIAELDHPAMLSFFPTITISLILIGTFLATWVPSLALLIWQIGGIGQLLLTLLILTRWIHHDHFEIHHISPAWFIPAVGNVIAIAQTNIKRMLAYSTIGHMGFVFMGLLAGTPEGYGAGMFYVIVYSLMSAAGFGMVILLSGHGIEAEKLEDFKGLNQRNPWYAAIMAMVMFSMAGVPVFVGFFAKWLVIQATLEAGMVWLAMSLSIAAEAAAKEQQTASGL